MKCRMCGKNAASGSLSVSRGGGAEWVLDTCSRQKCISRAKDTLVPMLQFSWSPIPEYVAWSAS